MTSQEAALVQEALNRGVLMYAYDQAAWHGTDDLREKMPDRLAEVGGWIVDGSADAPHLVVLDRDEADPHALYVADFKEGKLISSRVLERSSDRSLSPPRRTMAQALRAARRAIEAVGTKYCVAKPFNTIVVPATGGRPAAVYFLTPQTKADSLPLAGHYVVEVSAEGQAGAVQRFMKSDCAELPLLDNNGKRSAMLMMSDLLHQVPTEVHVFSSVTGRIPVYVVTTLNQHLWAVEGSHIRLVKIGT